MKVRSPILSSSVARGIAILCGAVFVATAHTALAGINVWTSHGPEGGNIKALAIDPSTPSTLYAGLGNNDGSGGVFKSTDSGGSWSPASTGLSGFQALLVYALVIDPTTPSTLYAGTYGGGVYQSTNSGGSWSAVNTGLSGGTRWIYTLAINPTTPSTLYAGTTAFGVYQSTNSGGNWSAVNTGLSDGHRWIYALAIDPTTPSTLYAGTWEGEVFESTNSGDSWSAVNTGTVSLSALAIDPTTPSTLYAGAGGGVYQSTNSGGSWSAVNTGLTHTVAALAIDPTTPSTLYAGTTAFGVYQSTNSGGNWSAINTGLSDGHRWIYALAIDPTTPSTLYAGTYGGGVFDIEQVPPATPTATPTSAAGQVRLTDYFYPVQTGATWLYQGPDQGDGSTHTRVRMANTNYPLTLYNPTAYTQNVLLFDEDYGYFNGTTFVSTDNWQEYWSIANGLANYGDDDLPEESLRGAMTPFPVDMTVGQSATRQGPVYDGAGRFLGNASLTMQLIERTAVTVPAGTFADCVHLRFTLTLDGSPQVQDVWWALGVGQVRRTRISGYEPDENNGGYLQELASYTIPVTPTPIATLTPSPTPPPSACVGDCGGTQTVAINDLITLVNIALGNAQPSACAHGVPSGADVTIALIIQAVNNALGGLGVRCASVSPVVTLSANPVSLQSNQATTLSWSVSNATRCTASGDWSGAKNSAGGSQVINVGASAGSRTYNLSCTGPGGTVSRSVVVTVTAFQPDVCKYIGTCTGTFSGDDDGTWSVSIDNNCRLSGSGDSADGDHFTGTGNVTSGGGFTLVAGSVSTGAVFSGQIDNSGRVSGTLWNAYWQEGGTFEGHCVF
jgi:hypothetical protein